MNFEKKIERASHINVTPISYLTEISMVADFVFQSMHNDYDIGPAIQIGASVPSHDGYSFNSILLNKVDFNIKRSKSWFIIPELPNSSNTEVLNLSDNERVKKWRECLSGTAATGIVSLLVHMYPLAEYCLYPQTNSSLLVPERIPQGIFENMKAEINEYFQNVLILPGPF